MNTIALPALLLIFAGAGHVAVTLVPPTDDSGRRMASAAAVLIESFDQKQRTKACFEFKDAERTNWHFVPKIYPGVLLQDLKPVQKRAVHQLLHTVLSASGYHKTTTIIKLEDTLREFAEAAGRKAPHRDPGRYALAFFGTPAAKSPWGFRLQGHHISWNFSSVNNKIASTPAFLGSNPAEIRKGPHAGLRALPDEEDLGFELLGSLDREQTKAAILSGKAPQDVLWGPGKKKSVLGEPAGVAWKSMTGPQRKILWRLVETYLHNLKRDLAESEIGKIDKAGRDEIRFAWMGSTTRGQGHYYCVRGKTFAIEYDNTQNGANHVHTVWHDLTGDFATDLLREHYDKHHKKK